MIDLAGWRAVLHRWAGRRLARVLPRRWAPPALLGRIDGVRDGRLNGWAADPADPDRPLTLRLVAGDRVIIVVADQYRADVHHAGIGRGDCGFSVPVARLPAGIPCRIHAERAHPLPAARAGAAADAWIELAGSPIDPHVRPAPAVRIDTADYAFHLDAGRPGHGLTGFALDPTAPASRRRLGVRQAGRIIAETRATLQRAEAEAFGADGLHGFAFPPIAIAGPPLEVVDLDAGRVLARWEGQGRRAHWTAR